MYSHLKFIPHTLGQTFKRCKSLYLYINQLSDLHHMMIWAACNFYLLLHVNTEKLNILCYLPHTRPFNGICLHLFAQVICVNFHSKQLWKGTWMNSFYCIFLHSIFNTNFCLLESKAFHMPVHYSAGSCRRGTPEERPVMQRYLCNMAFQMLTAL